MRRPELFGSAGTKEVNFFGEVKQRGRSAYLSRFPAEEHRKILLDASPSYIQNRDDSADRIRSVLEADAVTIAILVRDPVETFFSHYLHELKSTIGRPSWRRQPRPATFRLEDPAVTARYLRPRAPAVARFRAVFGEACLGFPMGALFDGSLRARLGAVLGAELAPFDGSEVINRGGFVPRYLWGGPRGLVLEQDGRPFRVPPRALVFVAEERSELQAYATAEEAAAFQRLGESFTREIALDRAALQPLLEDHLAVCAALGLEPIRRSVEDAVRLAAPEARLSERVLERLPVI
ncbi:hypothetical protein DFH01_16980 [Falsiroseomonas bella]|uniref:Sulfotransferase domain-containing protein n=1 Tax=Falsiroseomonas bella TaxID=2184016 RepID=A0A317FCR2_9PROT|nr:hypothetical protein [Falsiroseomonas bella]PWS35328.1 hypothetical protein DFH01_16980 [Falsiroseomonas bella]